MVRAILLAGGFGTRLEKGAQAYQGPMQDQVREWIIGKSKGLVPIQGRAIVDYQLEQILACGIKKEDVYIHSNAKFHDQYIAWAREKEIPEQNVHSNGINHRENMLEQIGDMLLAIKNIGIDRPLFMFAYDTLVHHHDDTLYSFIDMVQAYQTDQMSRVIVYKKLENLSRHGIVQADAQGNVIGFEEKPEEPKSDLCNGSIYFYSPEKLQELLKKEDELPFKGNPLQAIWQGFKVEIVGKRVDIGHIDDVLKHNNVPISAQAQTSIRFNNHHS